MCKLAKYMFLLNISCQHLGDECNLGGFLVPFGHRVGGMYIFGIYVSWLNICLYWLYHANTWEMNVIWRVSLCHSGTRLWECTFLEYVSVKYITLQWIYNANSWGRKVIWRVSLCHSDTLLWECTVLEYMLVEYITLY